MTAKKVKKTKGMYEELIKKGNDSIWRHDILKDLDRTFPGHPYFNKD